MDKTWPVYHPAISLILGGVRYMSNTELFIWDADRDGTPQSFEEATQMVLELRRKKCTATQNMFRFAQSGEDELIEIFGGFSSRFNPSKAAIAWDMSFDDWEALLPMLVICANKNNLVVYYENIIMLFLPDGSVLPDEGEEAWDALQEHSDDTSSIPSTKGKFAKYFEERLLKMLSKHGKWEKTKRPWLNNGNNVFFLRINDQFSLYVANEIQGEAGEFISLVSAFFCCIPVEKIMSKFSFYKPEIVFSSNLLTQLIGYKLEKIKMRNEQDVIRIINDVGSCMFPALTNVRNINDLDALLNGNIDINFKDYFHSYVFQPQCLAVARLAGNPHFEELVVKIQSSKGWYVNAEHLENELPRFIQYLRDEVTPIA
jgi:hypothetical protein